MNRLLTSYSGRKLALYIGCVLFVLGSVIQASAFSLAQMTIGRLIIGMGVGSAAMIIVSIALLFFLCHISDS